MKKIISLIFIAFFAISVPAFAQETKAEEPQNEDMGKRILVNRWYQNWEISARIGTQAYMGEYCTTHFKFKDWWVLPSIDLGMSKWATHTIGFSIGFTYSPFKSLYYTGQGSTQPQTATFAKPATDEVYKTNFNIARGHMGNAYISAIIDLCNLFGGYKKDRVYDLIASVGGGIMFPLSYSQYRPVSASFNAGLINKFNVSKHLSVDLAIRGTLHDDMFNGVSYYTDGDRRNISVDATIGATVGVSYKFDFPKKKSKAAKADRINREGWTEVNEIVQYTEPYRAIKQEVVAAQAAVLAANNALSAAKKATKVQHDTVLVKEPFSYRQMVNFAIDKRKITNREKVSIMLASEVIKKHPDTKFLIQGFADIQTSYQAYNQKLSEKRANAVYDVLVKEFGVNPDQLINSAEGGVDYMFFNDKQCSRTVMIVAVPK